MNASLDLAPGEVVALVGENGAGKTTLMNVLYGMVTPDTGDIRINGAPVQAWNPRKALAQGIGMVHQHFMLSGSLTVTENIILGAEPSRFGFIDWKKAHAEVKASAEAHGFRLDVQARVEDLTVGAQQKVEILKILHRGAKVLILDEPTAVLTPQETDELLAAIQSLKAQGRTIVIISHKLRDVMLVADRIVVMRRGERVLETRPSETTREALALAMVGEGRASVDASFHQRSAIAAADAPELRVTDARAVNRMGQPALQGVSFRVAPGEILGIAGVEGHGQRELVAGITGALPFLSGTVSFGSRDVTHVSIHDRRAQGLAHIPEDRHRDAIIGVLTVSENVALTRSRQAPFAKGPQGLQIDFEGRASRSAALVEAYDVRPKAIDIPMAGLSGGNQQKVVVARELDGVIRWVVATQPTRGLDLGAVNQVHSRLLAARNAGACVLLVSLDLDELLTLSDRIVVLFQGRIAGEQTRGAFEERQLGRWMLGAQDAT